jgi:hypothetical protein
MFDKSFQTLSFAADPPEGSGGTKTKVGTGFVTGDSTASEPPVLPADPPEGTGGTETTSTTDGSTTAE